MSEQESLKPCPFCGSAARPALENDEWIECSSTACDAMQSGAAPRFDAITAWNTRARPEPSEAVVEAVAREIGERYDGYADPIDTPDNWARAISAARAAIAAYEAERLT